MNIKNMRGAIDAVLFDLDGTLLDTAADLAAALNAILQRHGRAPLAPEAVRPYVSRGGMALVRLGFELPQEAEATPAQAARAKNLYDELLDFYGANLSANTRLFPGMDALLARLERRRRWGIVTNKPQFLTAPLLADMRLTKRAACVVSGDTLEKRKPWPQPLLHACETLAIAPACAIYVGDDARDIECGRRAGMRTVAAAYGYIPPGDDPRNWGADAIIQHPDDIQQWLD